MLCSNAGCSIDIETATDLGRLYLTNFLSFITKTFDRKIVVTFLSISYTFTEGILTFFERHYKQQLLRVSLRRQVRLSKKIQKSMPQSNENSIMMF